MSQDLIQIVNEDDEPVGAATIDAAQAQGLIHRIAMVFIEDGKGHVLLQCRAAHARLYPGRWTYAASGHVDVGETYETAARRELEEEIGVKDIELVEDGYYRKKKEYEGRQLNRFYKTFTATLPRDYRLTLQVEEVSEARWFAREEVTRIAYEHPEELTDGLCELAKAWRPA